MIVRVHDCWFGRGVMAKGGGLGEDNDSLREPVEMTQHFYVG